MADEKFNQFELPPQGPTSNIVSTADGSVLQSGVFRSPKYVKGVSGWQLDADGNAEFLSVTVHGYTLTSKGSFGGDGTDGDLTIISGTTTVDLGSAAYVVLNYGKVSITGTGQLAFSNPHSGGTVVIIKAKNWDLTSSATPNIDCSGLGAAAGTGGAADANGTDGTVANDILALDSSNGKLGKNTGVDGSAAGVVYTSKGLYSITSSRMYRKSLFITAGSGGGGGAGGSGAGTDGAGGAGGRGGGALIIECSGAWNFTGTISVAGKNGTNGSTGASGCGGGGGGGGAGGMCLVMYNTLTANSGTITKTGGNGGNGGNGQTNGGAGGGGGGGGGMYAGAGGAGGLNQNSGNGAAGSNGTSGGGSGGTGGSAGTNLGSSVGGSGGGGGCGGESLVIQNTIFG